MTHGFRDKHPALAAAIDDLIKEADQATIVVHMDHHGVDDQAKCLECAGYLRASRIIYEEIGEPDEDADIDLDGR